MNILDIIILVCFVPAVFTGLKRGFLGQLAGLLALVTGIILSVRHASGLCAWLQGQVSMPEQVLKVMSFAIILCLTVVAFQAVARILEKTLRIATLDWVNRLLGAFIAIMTCCMVLGLVFSLLEPLNATAGIISQENLDKSVLYGPVKNIFEAIFPYVKELFQAAGETIKSVSQ